VVLGWLADGWMAVACAQGMRICCVSLRSATGTRGGCTLSAWRITERVRANRSPTATHAASSCHRWKKLSEEGALWVRPTAMQHQRRRRSSSSHAFVCLQKRLLNARWPVAYCAHPDVVPNCAWKQLYRRCDTSSYRFISSRLLCCGSIARHLESHSHARPRTRHVSELNVELGAQRERTKRSHRRKLLNTVSTGLTDITISMVHAWLAVH
jgi:hypothetical protein